MAEDKDREARMGTPPREYETHPRRAVTARDRERSALELWRRLLDPPAPWYHRAASWLKAIAVRWGRSTRATKAIAPGPPPPRPPDDGPKVITVQQLLDARRLQKMPSGRRPH